LEEGLRSKIKPNIKSAQSIKRWTQTMWSRALDSTLHWPDGGLEIQASPTVGNPLKVRIQTIENPGTAYYNGLSRANDI